ncbi:MAG: hypothetical protein ACI4ML_09420, partial [Aristaeellaceae bacterium]
PGVPESFKVLIKELQALCLDIKVLDANKNEIIIPELDPEDMMSPEPSGVREDEEENKPELPAIEDDADADDVIEDDFSREDFSLGGDDELDDDFNMGDLDLDPLE